MSKRARLFDWIGNSGWLGRLSGGLSYLLAGDGGKRLRGLSIYPDMLDRSSLWVKGWGKRGRLNHFVAYFKLVL